MLIEHHINSIELKQIIKFNFNQVQHGKMDLEKKLVTKIEK
jgi:hypothetical protein